MRVPSVLIISAIVILMLVTQFYMVSAFGKEPVIFCRVLLTAHIRHTRSKVLHKHTAAGVGNLYRGTQCLNLGALFGYGIALDDA